MRSLTKPKHAGVPSFEEEQKETPSQEAAESPEMEQAEQEAGVEQGNVPEEFQQQVLEMLDGLSIAEVEYLNTQVTDKLKALKRSETPAEKKRVFDASEMPE